MKQCCAWGFGRVCMPQCVVPRTASGRVHTYCCGQPELVCADCGGDCGGGRYILRQPMIAEIPVEIDATAYAGTPFFQCDPCQSWNGEGE